MYLVFVILVWVFFAWIFIDRNKWLETYPTILFYITVNMSYNFLYFNHTLWAYKAVTTRYLNHTLIELGFSYIILPICIIIYLQRAPKPSTEMRQVIRLMIYILLWALAFSVIEVLFGNMNMFVYDNGWNQIWSSAFNVMMFAMLLLHRYKTGLALVLAVIVAISFVWLFPVPLEQMK